MLGDKHISWIDNKDNSTEYFYGKEYGTDNYYKITWDGQATQIANPYGSSDKGSGWIGNYGKVKLSYKNSQFDNFPNYKKSELNSFFNDLLA